VDRRGFLSTETTTERYDENKSYRGFRTPSRATLPLIVVGGIVVAIMVSIGLGFLMDGVYDNRALPGMNVAGYDISGMDLMELPTFLDETQGDISLSIEVGNQSRPANASDLGISIDRDRVLMNIHEKSTQKFWIYRGIQSTPIRLDVDIDRTQFDSWLADTFPDSYDQPINAGLSFNSTTGVFDLTEPSAGTGVADQELDQIRDTLGLEPRGATFGLKPTPVDPTVGSQEATDIQLWVNERLATTCSFTETAATTTNNETIYTLTPLDIASLVTMNTTAEGGLNATFTLEKVTEYVSESFPEKVNREPQNRRVVLNHKQEEVRVLTQGAVGRTLTQTESLPHHILSCLMNAEDTVIALSFTEAAFSVEEAQPTIADPPPGWAARHWVNVDLTTQTVTLMNGSKVGDTFILSSGKPGMDTPTGTFSVYAKTRSQTVSGCGGGECYSFPGVRWLVWFKGNYGFHTAYWHDDFGTPVSHGCLNMREAEAKKVFDWLARGDKVVIHL